MTRSALKPSVSSCRYIGRFVALLLREDVGGAVDVKVGDRGPILGRVDPRIYFRIKSPHLTRGWRNETFNANRAALPDEL